MHWSDPATWPKAALYALVSVLALSEMAILAQARMPTADPDYRAFFIDRTTTCLNTSAPGDYTLGTDLSFRSAASEQNAKLRVCGWSGPADDGAHSVGTTSRLRVKLDASDAALALTLTIAGASDRPQRVEVSANGTLLGEMQANGKDIPYQKTFEVPAAVRGGADKLEITLAYPDAYFAYQRASLTRKRAIKLQAFRLAELHPRAEM